MAAIEKKQKADTPNGKMLNLKGLCLLSSALLTSKLAHRFG